MSAVYHSSRPYFVIDVTGSKKLGNCFWATFYRITSKNKLSRAQIDGLRDAHLIGGGQGFYVRSQCDGKEEPAGHDVTKCIDTETGKPAIRYDGEPYPDSQCPYYVYDVEDQCDSSD